ncbi:hypothetical protein INS49_004398 [Diaporthe citri]|uniref:uncharacterized protein n=1 Tax=Diaporthe citri TaxID=83186 RepID=UPI001C801E7E|nr:uncharacterized protein INS49_004398 [Diaporthe citri]KAG6354381.1 hypothetical protein INS49_004398 [Diaporthe citri]
MACEGDEWRTSACCGLLSPPSKFLSLILNHGLSEHYVLETSHGKNTIIIAGANGSLAIPTVDHLLKTSPTLVLTVRDASDSDVNTTTLRGVVARYPQAKVSIRELDFARLSAVHDFARHVAAEISEGSLPRLSSIVWTAYHWNLVGPFQMTEDGHEKTIQVTYLSHVALILRLIGCFRPEGGRIVLFSSDPSWSISSSPEDDPAVDAFGHGLHRHANAKLASVMFTHALNRRLQQDDQLKNITVVVMNPGHLSDSRALRVNTPLKLVMLSVVLRPFPDPTARAVAQFSVDVAHLATNEALPGVRGYLELLKPYDGSKDSQDEKTRDVLWAKSAESVGVTAQDTVLGALSR